MSRYINNVFEINIQILFRGIKIFTYLTFIIVNFISKYNNTIMNNIYRNFVNRNSIPNIFSLGYYALRECINSSINFLFPLDKEILFYDFETDKFL